MEPITVKQLENSYRKAFRKLREPYTRLTNNTPKPQQPEIPNLYSTPKTETVRLYEGYVDV